MRAALVDRPGSCSLIDLDRPHPHGNAVLVRVEYCGISGTCLHSYRGDFPGTIYPVVPGLEIVGRVEDSGQDAGSVQRGQRVVIEPTLTCGRCAACRVGRYNCCARLQLLGVHTQGGMADFVAVPGDRVHVVPAAISPLVAVLCEPFAIGMQAVERAGVGAGDDVVLLGAGVIGATVLLISRSRGARVLVVDPEPARRASASSLGAERVASSAECDEAVSEFTDGDGARVVIDATGRPEAIAQTVRLACPAGRIGIVGVTSDPVCLSALDIVRKELDIYGVRNCRGLYPRTLRFLERHQAEAARLISRVWQLDEVAEAFRSADTAGPAELRYVLEVGP